MSDNNKEFERTAESDKTDQRATEKSNPLGVKGKERRKLAGLGIGAPVVLTLASRSVLAGQCLSNMLSGNLSDPNRNSTCSKGWSPGGWGQPGGNISSYTTLGAWTAIGFNYGYYDKNLPNCSANGSASQAVCYSGGSKISNLPDGALNPDGAPATATLREVLNDPKNYQKTRHLICAYFNAKLGALPGSTFHYILTVQQVLDLAHGTLTPPGGMSINQFLDSTW
jgi:hypothetical protein